MKILVILRKADHFEGGLSFFGRDTSGMIVCSCNIIARRDIEAIIEEILVEDPYAVLTPGLLYHRLGRRGRCCGCFPNVSRILVEHGTLVREAMANGEWSEGDAEEERRAG